MASLGLCKKAHVAGRISGSSNIGRLPVRPPCRQKRTALLRPAATGPNYGPFGNRPPPRWGDAASQHRRAALSRLISATTDWRDLVALVDQVGPELEPIHLYHLMTRVNQLYGPGKPPLSSSEQEQVQALMSWIVRRNYDLEQAAEAARGGPKQGKAGGWTTRPSSLSSTRQGRQPLSSLGSPVIGATAKALAAMRQQEELHRQQQQQLRERQAAEAAAAARHEEQVKKQQRRDLLQEMARQAASRPHRLTPQALNSLLSALAAEQEDMAEEGAGQSTPTGRSSSDRSTRMARQQLDEEEDDEAEQALRFSDGGQGLRDRAQEYGRLEPVLATEWYDQQLRQALDQGLNLGSISPAAMSGFLSREINRAGGLVKEGSPGSRSRGLTALGRLLGRYSQVLTLQHYSLMAHVLGEYVSSSEAAGEAVEELAAQVFKRCLPGAAAADPASLTSLIAASADMGLYHPQLLPELLKRAFQIMAGQEAGFSRSGPTGFSARQLGVLLHSLARLGLRPAESWLAQFLSTAGALLPSCSLVDLERLSTSLLLMRLTPGRAWLSAAEDQVETLVAQHHQQQQQEPQQEEEEEAAGGWRQVLLPCVKALALLGGRRSRVWYQSLVAAKEERERQEQRQAQEAARQEEEQQRAAAAGARAREEEMQRQAAGRERLNQQQQQLQQREGPLAAGRAMPAAGASSVEHHLKQAEAMRGRQQRRHQRKLQHHLKHKPEHQQQQGVAANSRAVGGAPPLASVDEWMSGALEDLDLTTKPSAQSAAAGGGGGGASTPFDRVLLPRSEQLPELQQLGPEESRAGAGAAGGAGGKEAAQLQPGLASGEWSSEQAIRWAEADGEEKSSAVELQQMLDDSPAVQQEQQQQSVRSEADSAAALAQLMAEVDEGSGSGGAEEAEAAAQRMREAAQDLGLEEEEKEGGLEDLQAAAAAVEQAGKALEQLEAAAAAVKQQQEGVRKCKAPARPLGYSGLATFKAAAKTLATGAPSRTLLSGVLEAVELEMKEAAAELALKQGGPKGGFSSGNDSDDPYAKSISTIMEDMGRLRQRAAQEKASTRDTALAEVVRSLLPLLDSFEAAVDAHARVQATGGAPSSPQEDLIHAAYRALQVQLLEVLKKEGVELISEVGVPFDPELHEALMRQEAPEGVADGEVLTVLRRGYQVGDRLVRPAMVVVAFRD